MTQVFSACWSISQHCNGVFIYFSYNLTPVVILLPKEMSNTVPLYRYWKSQIYDHLYNKNEFGTVTPGENGNHYYVSESIACHVLPYNQQRDM